MASSRWGDAITRLLAERRWTRRQLAESASVQPNTLTNIIKHGRAADTATLVRIAAALGVDIAELFLSPEQSVALNAYKQDRVGRLRDLVVKELSGTVTAMVTQELERMGHFIDLDAGQRRSEYRQPKRASTTRKPSTKKKK